MSKYAAQAANARRMLTDKGAAVTGVRKTAPVYNPATGGYTTGADVALAGVAVFVNYPESEVDGQRILATDTKLVYAGDVVQIGDVVAGRRVVNVKNVDPDNSGAPIIQHLQVRG